MTTATSLIELLLNLVKRDPEAIAAYQADPEDYLSDGGDFSPPAIRDALLLLHDGQEAGFNREHNTGGNHVQVQVPPPANPPEPLPGESHQEAGIRYLNTYMTNNSIVDSPVDQQVDTEGASEEDVVIDDEEDEEDDVDIDMDDDDSDDDDDDSDDDEDDDDSDSEDDSDEEDDEDEDEEDDDSDSEDDDSDDDTTSFGSGDTTSVDAGDDVSADDDSGLAGGGDGSVDHSDNSVNDSLNATTEDSYDSSDDSYSSSTEYTDNGEYHAGDSLHAHIS